MEISYDSMLIDFENKLNGVKEKTGEEIIEDVMKKFDRRSKK